MKRIHSTITYGNRANWDTLDDWQKKANPWTVELRYAGRRMTVGFWTGSLAGDPDTHSVVSCLASDCSGFENAGSFEEWAAAYGYDEDSRKAERIYRAVAKQARKLKALLGEAYQETVFMNEDELKSICV